MLPPGAKAGVRSNLLDIPKGHVGRKREEALDIGAPRDRWRPLSEQGHGDIIPGILLQLAGNRLALIERTGERPLVAQLLVQDVLGPAEPAGFTDGHMGDEADRIVEAFARAPGNEDVPAALGDGLLDGAPGYHGAP